MVVEVVVVVDAVVVVDVDVDVDDTVKLVESNGYLYKL